MTLAPSFGGEDGKGPFRQLSRACVAAGAGSIRGGDPSAEAAMAAFNLGAGVRAGADWAGFKRFHLESGSFRFRPAPADRKTAMRHSEHHVCERIVAGDIGRASQ